MIIKRLLIASIFYFTILGQIKGQSVDINVQGEIYEYATYYVSSFDVATGATNVQIFNYSLEASVYPVFIKIRFKATILSPGLGINSDATIVEIETDPFLIQDGLYLDNRDLSSEITFLNDNSGNQIELKGQLIEVLDPALSEAIMQTIMQNDPKAFRTMYPNAKRGDFLSRIYWRLFLHIFPFIVYRMARCITA